MAVTFDRGDVKLYLDGTQIGHGTAYSPLTGNNLPLRIGADSNGQNLFNGIIDEVRIWNYARTQEEIRSTMNYTLTGIDPGLVGYWNFDSGTADDKTPNGNDGTLIGGAKIERIDGFLSPKPLPDVEGPHALSLDGNGDHVQIPENPVFDITNQVTMEAWIFINSFGDQKIISKRPAYVIAIVNQKAETEIFTDGSSINTRAVSGGTISEQKRANRLHHQPAGAYRKSG